MAASASYVRKPEVTRTVRLSPSDTLYRQRTSTPYQQQAITWNGPLETLLGYPPESAEDTEAWWLDRIHPDDASRVLESLTQHLAPAVHSNPLAAQNRIWGPDYRFRHALGHYVTVSDRCITTRDAHGNVTRMDSIVFDKEARRVEREVHEKFLASHDQLATVANNTPSGIFMMNPSGYPTFMNTAAEQITGFRLHEITDYTFHASVHSCRPNGEPYPLQDCPVFNHQQNGTSAKNDSEVFIHKDGTFYDIVYSVSSVGDNYASGGSVIEFRDVTEEKRIDQERLKAMLLNEQQSVRIKESDAHKANMTGFVAFVCHEIRNPLQGIMGSTEFLLDTLHKIDAISAKICRPDFSTQENSQSKREVLSPIASLNGLQPLALPRSNTADADIGMLSDLTTLIEDAKKLVRNIQTCAEHQALITNNVLDLSRLDAGKVEPSYDIVDVYSLCPQAIAMMQARAQAKNIKLALAKPDQPPLYLKADTTILSQVLLNLISNAIKFTPESGSITIDMYPESENSLHQTVLHFSVTDTGLGMTEAEQQRLFQRFSQANRRVAQLYGGSGLGLSISKELVKVLGGDMQVKSAPGEGSTFSFTSVHNPPTPEELAGLFQATSLSNGVGARELPNLVPANDEVPSPRFQIIGVAEDNPINLKHLAKHLEILGYKTVLCTNGKDILDKFCEPDSAIEAVIMDMSMPIMDGLESTRLMREFEAKGGARRIPIIALSGNALKEQITAARAAGTSDYLVKPCKQADLARALSYWEHIIHTDAPHTPMHERSEASLRKK